jgi:hypothetical protein
VTESNWAAAGGSVSLAHIAGSVGLSKTGQRIAWVRSYFAAKAQQFKGWIVHFIAARTYAPLPFIADLIPLCTPLPVDVEQQESARHLQRESNDI